MKITLKTRIFTLVSVLVLLSMLAQSFFLLSGTGDRLNAGFRANGVVIAKNFMRNSVDGIIIEDEDGLNRTIETLFESKDVIYANIYDSEGTAIASKSDNQIENINISSVDSNRREIEVSEIVVGEDNNIPVLDFKMPVFDEDNEYIRCVQVGINLSSIQVEIRKMAIRAMVLVAVFIVIGFVASFLVANSIANPILKLVSATSLVAKGDLSQRVSIKSNDEMGVLLQSFNDMTENL
jgi:methyl-accepting chemotaxis protein